MQKDAARKRLERELESQQQALERRKKDADRHRAARENETEEQSQTRRENDTNWRRATRAAETAEKRQERLAREAQSRRRKKLTLQNAGFDYEPNTDLLSYPDLNIGGMTKICQHCGAKKFKKETDAFCCGNGKIDPPNIQAPPQPLKNLMEGKTAESKKFLRQIRSYNSAFQMSSFRATQIKQKSGFKGSFKIQGQLYHKMGALQANRSGEEKFVQMYFIKNIKEQADRRCTVVQNLD